MPGGLQSGVGQTQEWLRPFPSPGCHRRPAARTVVPSILSTDAARSTAHPDQPGGPDLEWLESDLRRRLQRAAVAGGMSVAAVCEQWLREGLERFEAHLPGEDPDGSGRCFLRTGTSSLGPVPLPVQQ